MKILITGGAGYIGSHVAKQLLETTQYDITVLDNLSTGYVKTIQTLKTIRDFEFIELDLKEFNDVNLLLQTKLFDVIIHFAASSIVSGADMFYKNDKLLPRIGECHELETHLIPPVIKTALGKRNILNIYGDNFDTFDGSCIRDYIHVEDLANAHIEAISYLEKNSSDIFNLGYAKGYSVKEIVNNIKNMTNVNFETKIVEKRDGDPAFLVVDNSKILDKMNWKPKFNNLKSICQSAYEWEKIK